MTRALIAQFDDTGRFVEALAALKAAGLTPFDALMPFSVPEAMTMLAPSIAGIRVIMAAAGFGVAIFAYALQWYSAAIAYPIDSGGRPTNSWPVFLLVPFEVGILAAAIAGFATLLVSGGLPRLHHPVFDYPGVERATQDRFFVLVARAGNDAADERVRRLLFDAGAISIGEGEA